MFGRNQQVPNNARGYTHGWKNIIVLGRHNLCRHTYLCVYILCVAPRPTFSTRVHISPFAPSPPMGPVARSAASVYKATCTRPYVRVPTSIYWIDDFFPVREIYARALLGPDGVIGLFRPPLPSLCVSQRKLSTPLVSSELTKFQRLSIPWTAFVTRKRRSLEPLHNLCCV